MHICSVLYSGDVHAICVVFYPFRTLLSTTRDSSSFRGAANPALLMIIL